MKKHTLFLLTIVIVLLCSSSQKQTQFPFVHVENGQLFKDGKPYYYVGTNFWYGAILASEGEGGNRDRLIKELDYLKSIGIDNLRVLVGSDGEQGVKSKVEPTLQIAPGVYNDTILAGLDYLLTEMGKRKMVAVLYLNNSWEWSGGYSQYVAWAEEGKAPVPAIDGWGAYMGYARKFHQSDKAKAMFANYVKDIITRTNRYSGLKYTDDPAIMSWQIGNEPRAFSNENKEPFAAWMASVSTLIKSLDKNHLVSTGNEGTQGCEMDITLFEKIHADPNVDYVNIHIWPFNWNWAKRNDLEGSIGSAKENTGKYIDEHLAIANKLQKPLVIEEFGYPRDGFLFSPGSPTTLRNDYYKYVFDRIANDSPSGKLLAGCNFWAWGGFARPSDKHIFWEKGDDYTGDPAQEEQGLNSVFAGDSTTEIIKDANKRLIK